MGVDVSQHIAIRVSDIDRAARFYVELFGGTYLTRPFTLSGPELEPLFGGHEGLEVKVCLLAFDHGNMELFEFVHPREPMDELDQTRANLVHWCIQVDDVHETLARVEAAGGKAVHPVLDWGGAYVVYGRSEKDEYGGKLRLAPSPRLGLLRQGDEVRVTGAVVRGPSGPEYEIESLELGD